MEKDIFTENYGNSKQNFLIFSKTKFNAGKMRIKRTKIYENFRFISLRTVANSDECQKG